MTFLEYEILRNSSMVDEVGSLANHVGFGLSVSTDVFCTTMDHTKGPTNRCLHFIWHNIYRTMDAYLMNTSPRIISGILDDLSN